MSAIQPTLEILVDSQIHLPKIPQLKSVSDSLKRTFRDAVIVTPQEYQLPQTLLPHVTAILRRHHVSFLIIDRRTTASWRAINAPALTASTQQLGALKKLQLSESGVIVAPDRVDHGAIVLLLQQYRRQKALVLCASIREVKAWIRIFRDTYRVPPEDLSSNDINPPHAAITIATYAEIESAIKAKSCSHFGLVVCTSLEQGPSDEIRHACNHLDVKYVYGITTEPERSDKQHRLLWVTLGGLLYQIPSLDDRGLRFSYRVRETGFRFDYQRREQYQALLAALACDEKRNQLIAAEVIQEAASGASCLVVSERKDQLHALCDILGEQITSALITSDTSFDERDHFINRFNTRTIQTLLVTTPLITETFHIPIVERIFIAFPFSYPQKLEPLTRNLFFPSQGKDRIILFDYHDAAIAPLHRAFEKRAQHIQRLQRSIDEKFINWAQLSLGI